MSAKYFNELLNRRIKEKKLTKRLLAQMMGMSSSNLYMKLSDPSKFSVGELRSLNRIFKFTDSEMRDILA